MRVKWSQNFLVNKDCARKAIRALEISDKDSVLEIGPGRGILTEELIILAHKLLAVEIDPDLCRDLSERFKNSANFILLGKDFLDFEHDDLSPFHGQPFKVIGNLPYAIVSKAIQKILDLPRWQSAVIMVQKEVADRILAKSGGREYGILTISVQLKSDVEKIGAVSRSSFKPAPHVDSVLLKLTPRKELLLKKEKESRFFRIVRAAFQQRRKTVLNSLSHGLKIPVVQVKEALEKSSLSRTARAEEFSKEDFLRLSQWL